jgi:hypothetical protein
MKNIPNEAIKEFIENVQIVLNSYEIDSRTKFMCIQTLTEQYKLIYLW